LAPWLSPPHEEPFPSATCRAIAWTDWNRLRCNRCDSAGIRYACLVGAAVVIFLSGIIAGVIFFAPPGSSGKLVGPIPVPGTSSILDNAKATAAPPKHVRGAEPSTAPGEQVAEASPSAAPVAPDQSSGTTTKTTTTTRAGDVKVLPPKDAWGSFSGSLSGIVLKGARDAETIAVAAWVWLARPSKEMNVIASSRFSGCSADATGHGYTFFVNQWGTGNQQLGVEWTGGGGGHPGCVNVVTSENAIPLEQWTHVAFAFGPASTFPGALPSESGTKVALFVNGKMQSTADNVYRTPQTSGKLSIGMTMDQKYPFQGRIADVLMLNAVPTMAQLEHIQSAGPAARFRAVVAQAAKHNKVDAALILYGEAEQGAQGGSAGDGSRKVDVVAGTVLVETVISAETSVISPGSEGEAPSSAFPASIPPPPPKAERIHLTDDRFSSGGNQWVSKRIKLDPSLVSGLVTDAATLAKGSWSDEVSEREMIESDAIGMQRAAEIKASMQFIWKNYHDKAWGMDEIRPRSGTSQNNWGGMAFTMIDALDTLWVMDMIDEFNEAADYIRTHLSFDVPRTVSVFETTIRGLGGLLAAYDLSGTRVFLEKAKELADRLVQSFNSPTGIPVAQINLKSGQGHNNGWTGSASILAELGTVQLEHRYLSHATGLGYYGKKAEKPIRVLRQHPQPHGLYPIYISPSSGQPQNRQITFGALGDSFYEYLVKVWVQGGQQGAGSDVMFREMYDEAMQGVHELLLKRSSPSNLLFIADFNGATTVDKMDHLACFVPGMLALGAWSATGQAGTERAQKDLQAAKAMAYTCFQMYDRQATGISPEFVEFRAGADIVVPGRAPFYILRPEAAESLFILHQLTGHPIYREWGWKMWKAIEKHCKTTYGFGSFPDVRDPTRQPDDRMESFFLAETIKYLYMLQSPDHPISLERFVFNTEAHPLRRFDHWGSNENRVDYGFAEAKPAEQPSLRGGEAKKPETAKPAPGQGSVEDVGEDVF
jgi:mannosyl-oligosaccharide alpha-1,2-mannosidase